MAKTAFSWFLRILTGLLGIILLGLILAAVIPVPRDPVLAVEDY